jgi:hypothetical protein
LGITIFCGAIQVSNKVIRGELILTIIGGVKVSVIEKSCLLSLLGLQDEATARRIHKDAFVRKRRRGMHKV